MTAEVTYPNAPIAEAILDIRVTPRGTLPDIFDQLAGFVKAHHAQYPQVAELQIGTATVVMGMEAPTASTQTSKSGFIAFTSDRKRSVQARIDGFSASRLMPYIDWHDLSSEARRLWTNYREITDPPLITRIALRYINRINIPLPIADLKEYFRTIPEISPDLPQGVSNFFMQLYLPQPDLNAMCILNLTMLPPTSQDTTSLLFDIDLFRISAVPQLEVEIWNTFDSMRDRKNKIFEASITDKARELFF